MNHADLLNPKVILNNSGTPLAIAAAREDVTLVKILIRRGASDGADVLHQAIHRNQQQIVKVLLDSKVPADSVSDGMSALSNAVSRSCPEIVQMLLKKNADITLANTSQPSGSVLMAATLADDVRIMEMLLKAGADPSVGGWPYADPLEAVIDQGHMRALSVLLANPQVKQQRSALNNALKAAAKGGCDDAAKALLNADADPNTILDGNNLLEIAAKNGHPEVVKVLYPVVLDRKGQSLEDYLYIAEQMPAFDASQAGRDVPELGEESASDFVSDSDDDIDISIPNSLGRSTQESEMEDWHRWIERRDTLLSGTITNKQAQHTQKSSSSMGVYDDDSD
ncbi:hypothetical protein N0V86_001178 [Didymella sp. IMI 355093]|nr:hypothetical protein N0V86_001178 [Didymella sp. IMI 355093]